MELRHCYANYVKKNKDYIFSHINRVFAPWNYVTVMLTM